MLASHLTDLIGAYQSLGMLWLYYKHTRTHTNYISGRKPCTGVIAFKEVRGL